MLTVDKRLCLGYIRLLSNFRNMDLTPKQQASEAIRQAQSILIVTGQNPSMDQVASVVAMAMVLRKFGKKVTALVSEQPHRGLGFLPLDQLDRDFSGLRDFILKVDLGKAEVDKLKYTIEDGKLNIHVTPFKGGFAPSDVTYAHGDYHYDLMIVVGVPHRAKIDRVAADLTNLPMVNFDFHRSNENYGAVNLIEPTAASLAEMLVSLSESLETGLIDEPIATAILTGIIASTDRFTAQHTTPKALTIAAQMMSAGAKQQQIIKSLYQQKERDRKPVQQQSQPPKPQPVAAQEQPDIPQIIMPEEGYETSYNPGQL